MGSFTAKEQSHAIAITVQSDVLVYYPWTHQDSCFAVAGLFICTCVNSSKLTYMLPLVDNCCFIQIIIYYYIIRMIDSYI